MFPILHDQEVHAVLAADVVERADSRLVPAATVLASRLPMKGGDRVRAESRADFERHDSCRVSLASEWEDCSSALESPTFVCPDTHVVIVSNKSGLIFQRTGSERWTPSFGQVFVTAKGESGVMIQATLG